MQDLFLKINNSNLVAVQWWIATSLKHVSVSCFCGYVACSYVVNNMLH